MSVKVECEHLRGIWLCYLILIFLQATGDMAEDGSAEFPTAFFEFWANPILCALLVPRECHFVRNDGQFPDTLVARNMALRI